MKRVLVTGASGTLGKQVIKYLLSEGKYDITAIDVKTRKNYKGLKKYRKRIRIIFDDITNKAIIDSLVKENDIVIHLASSIPFISNLDEDICKNNDYQGTKNIVDSIKKYNPSCYLIFASSTTVYGKQENFIEIKNTEEPDPLDGDYYSKYKLKAEEYITKTIKNYTIYRLSYILGNIKDDNLIFNVPINAEIEPILSENAGYAISATIDHKKTLNKRIINLSGGKKYRIPYKKYLLKVLECYGLTYKIWNDLLFTEKNFNISYYDDDNLNELINYRTKSASIYLDSLNRYKKNIKRLIPRLLALPIRLVIKLKKK